MCWRLHGSYWCVQRVTSRFVLIDISYALRMLWSHSPSCVPIHNEAGHYFPSGNPCWTKACSDTGVSCYGRQHWTHREIFPVSMPCCVCFVYSYQSLLSWQYSTSQFVLNLVCIFSSEWVNQPSEKLSMRLVRRYGLSWEASTWRLLLRAKNGNE